MRWWTSASSTVRCTTSSAGRRPGTRSGPSWSTVTRTSTTCCPSWPRPGAVGGYVFVDPDGFLADPAYDLGVLVREWCTHLLQAPDPTREVEGWCRLLAGVTGLDEEVIWEWGYIERVTTGLHLMGLGLVGRGRPFLDVAARLR